MLSGLWMRPSCAKPWAVVITRSAEAIAAVRVMLHLPDKSDCNELKETAGSSEVLARRLVHQGRTKAGGGRSHSLAVGELLENSLPVEPCILILGGSG